MRQSYFISAIFFWVIGFYFLEEVIQPDCGPRIYVKASAAPGGDGTSWATAFNKLQDAISQANSCPGISEIWVAQGTYFPDEGAGITDNDRAQSFNLKSGLAIYGGFEGNETELDQRTFASTILSGAIGTSNATDNSIHVVRGVVVDNTAILDGFTVTAGNANGAAPHDDGGGIYNLNSSPQIRNCNISGNQASDNGGGMVNSTASPSVTNCSFSANMLTGFGGGGAFANIFGSSPTFTGCSFSGNSAKFGGAGFNVNASQTFINCSFSGNAASADGAGIYNGSCTPAFINCIFSTNLAGEEGAGMYNSNADVSLTNCTFRGNSPIEDGGGIYNTNSSDPILTNCILWGNINGEIINVGASTATVTYSIVKGGYPGTGNLDKDPLFVSSGNLRLQNCSPAIDAGNNTVVTVSSDVEANERIVNATNDITAFVDIGAYEFGGTASTTKYYPDVDSDGYGAEDSPLRSCSQPGGYITVGGDCNDNNASVKPNAMEVCDDIDNDCDGQIDEGLKQTYWQDLDEDGYGNPNVYEVVCTKPSGYVSNSGDCDDDNAAINPATVWYQDADGDGFGNPSSLIITCNQPNGYVLNNSDCNDASNTNQPVIYVDKNANGLNNGTSWANAYKYLQDALSNTCAGVTQIWVAKGTYYPDEGAGYIDNEGFQSFKMKNNIAIYGGFAGGETSVAQRNWQTNVTTLSGDLLQNDGPNFTNYEDNSWIVVFNGGLITNTAILDGFTITAGQTDDRDEFVRNGGGMLNFNSDPTINNCIFTRNMGYVGAGMYNAFSDPRVTNCKFEDNKALENGGGVFNDHSSPSFVKCVFSGNRATLGAGAVNLEASANFTNCNFALNSAVAGGAMFNQASNVVIINTRFFLNVSAQGGNALYNNGAAPVIINCTFSINSSSSGGTVILAANNSSVTVINSILYGNAPALDHFSDPGSSISFTYSRTSAPGTGNINADPQFVDMPGGDLRLKNTSPLINVGNDAANSELYDLDGNPRKVGIIDLGAYESSCASPVIFVKKDAVGANNGTSWANAYTSLQDAVSNVTPCTTQIWVAKGTYFPDEGVGITNNDRHVGFKMKNNIAIYGGFAGNETLLSQRNWNTNKTILSGDIDQNDGADFANNSGNSVNVIFNRNDFNQNPLSSTAVLDGFTITAGNANVSNFLAGETGGGMYNLFVSPTIRNCIFSGNYAADYGGGMYNAESPVSIINCAFIKNNTVFGGGGVGNVWNTFPASSGPPVTLTNCSFSGNPSGGIITIMTTTILNNCIVWGNGTNEVLVHPQGGSFTINNSIIKGGFAGTGNLNADPLFLNPSLGDLRLQQNSPAINVGNDAANSTAFDLGAAPRKVGTIDMGAYELQTVCDDPGQWVIDEDNDGHYIGEVVTLCTSPGENYVAKGNQQAGDCDDHDPLVYYTGWLYLDNDGDGYTVGVWQCRGDNGLTQNGSDCDDTNPAKHNGQTVWIDNDGDGYTAGQVFLCYGATLPAGYRTNSAGSDCNDNDATVPKMYYRDEDGDGVTLVGQLLCTSTAPEGWITTGSTDIDCNDQDATVGKALLCWPDADGDGFGYDITVHDPRFTGFCWGLFISYENQLVYAFFIGFGDLTCSEEEPTKLPKFFCLSAPPPGWSLNNTDCNDEDKTIHPGAPELFDGKDNDCDGEIETCVPVSFTTTTLQPLQTNGCSTGTIASITFAYSTTPVTLTAQQYNVLSLPIAEGSCDLESVKYIDALNQVQTTGQLKVTRTFTATDGSGSTATITQQITVVDETAPAFTGVYNTVPIGCNPNAAAIENALGSATATDACDNVTITHTDGSVVSDGCSRSQIRKFKAIDGLGNTSTVSRTVSWTADVTPPVFTGYYTDVNLGCNPANPSGSLGTATATDACGAITNISSSDGSVVSSGCNRSKTRTFIATDGCLNTSTVSRTVRWIEDVTAPGFTGYYTEVNLGCNPANPDGSLGSASATDGCGAVTITQSDGAVISNGCNRSRTRTFTATDGCLNTSTTSRTVRWIYDVTAPTLTCAQTGTVTKSTSSDQCSYTVNGAEFNPTASDACGTPSLGWVVSGATSTSGSTTMAGVQLNFGYNTIKWKATDGCNNTSTCSFIVNVNKVKTTTSLVVSTTPATNPVTQQYSDKIKCVATVTPANCTGAGSIGGTVTFKIITSEGTVVLGSVPVASDGTATLEDTLLENQFYPGATSLLPSNGPLKPGNKTVTAVYSDTDPDYIVTNPTAPLVVTCEDAEVTYNGLNYFGANPNTNEGTITVSAFVLDANDVPVQARGDIRNATVTFKEGSSAGTVIGSSNIPVGLVNPSNFQEGIVTTNKTYTLTTQDINCGGKIVEVWAGTGNYYCGEFDEVVPVCLSLPGGDFVTGGGWIKMQNSEGSYAGTDDKKMHAALAFKWNKSNKNLQGNATIIYKRVANGVQKVYQIKSNSITSMIVNNVNDAGTVVTTGATYRMAQIVTKANFRDLTDPDFPIALFGNLTLTITAWESINTTDGSKDRVSVQLVGSGSQGMVFSSNWLSGATQWQQLGSGKMRVRNPSAEIPCTNCAGSGITAKTGQVDKATEVLSVEDLKVVAMPNPSNSSFKINARSNNHADKIIIQVVDMLGKIIETRNMNAEETIQIGERYRPGIYIIRFRQGLQVKQLKLVKLPD